METRVGMHFCANILLPKHVDRFSPRPTFVALGRESPPPNLYYSMEAPKMRCRGPVAFVSPIGCERAPAVALIAADGQTRSALLHWLTGHLHVFFCPFSKIHPYLLGPDIIMLLK